MLYDAAGKMNSITVSLVPFCLGLKLSKEFNRFSKLHVYPLFWKHFFAVAFLLGNHLPDDLRWKIIYFILILRAVDAHRSRVESKNHTWINLAGVAQLLGHHSLHRMVAGLIRAGAHA